MRYAEHPVPASAQAAVRIAWICRRKMNPVLRGAQWLCQGMACVPAEYLTDAAPAGTGISDSAGSHLRGAAGTAPH